MTTNTLNTLAARGVAVGLTTAGTLQVRSASLLTLEERAWLRANAGAIVAHLKDVTAPGQPVALSGNERWDARVALKLMADADVLVVQLGVDGRHPLVKDAGALVVSAHATHDLEALRYAVAEFVVVVRRLAGTKTDTT